MKIPPIQASWDGDNFKPEPRFVKTCNEHFIVGEKYQLDIIQQRSGRSHRHYFAQVTEAWNNLPESISSEFPSPEHLRARALIETGYRDEFRFVCASSRDAAQAAAACTRGNEYAVVSIADNAAVVWIPKSQDYKSMNHEVFTASKTAVLEWCFDIIRDPRRIKPHE